MRTLWLGVALVTGCAFAGAPAAADVVEAGLSGQCYAAAGNGGHDEGRVRIDSSDPAGATVKPLGGTGAVAGLAQFAQGTAASGDPADSCDGRNLNYIEADARAGAAAAQVCYNGAVVTDGSCPHSPAGPG